MIINVRLFNLLCGVALFWHFSASSVNSSEANSTESLVAGYGFEVMMAKLDFLQYKLYEIELGLKERDEEVKEKLTKLEDSIDGVQWAIHRHDRDAGHNITVLKAHSQKILTQQTTCASHEQMRKDIAQLTANTTDSAKFLQRYAELNALLTSNATATDKCMQKNTEISGPISRSNGPFKSCKEAPANVSGVYMIQLSDKEFPFGAFCEQNSFGGGDRYDGSLDFYRNWTEYQKGFGSLDREFWVGLERIHQLTSYQPHELLIEIKDFNGTYRYAHYGNFSIGNEYEQYVIKSLGEYKGTAGHALSTDMVTKFSTVDRDNDQNSNGSCAIVKKGAWWYNNCSRSNLNGLYLNKTDQTAMYWIDKKQDYSGLAYSRLLIRETKKYMYVPPNYLLYK
ncbi:AGAP011197-PA-like protein [Anopheles sinensis]|uniref:AGAP011197-PA-like protein n=1 Tax=Anopheles sinensis TaxID=74873 RepID=A0A084WCE2_ANOSI|nr:AGAP011197-PA-like protein [Anopheles sinensis]